MKKKMTSKYLKKVTPNYDHNILKMWYLKKLKYL